MRIILYRLELIYKYDYRHRSKISYYSVVYPVLEKHIKNMGSLFLKFNMGSNLSKIGIS